MMRSVFLFWCPAHSLFCLSIKIKKKHTRQHNNDGVRRLMLYIQHEESTAKTNSKKSKINKNKTKAKTENMNKNKRVVNRKGIKYNRKQQQQWKKNQQQQQRHKRKTVWSDRRKCLENLCVINYNNSWERDSARTNQYPGQRRDAPRAALRPGILPAPAI